MLIYVKPGKYRIKLRRVTLSICSIVHVPSIIHILMYYIIITNMFHERKFEKNEKKI